MAKRRMHYVSVPSLTPEQRALYPGIDESKARSQSSARASKIQADQIVGEILDKDGQLLYVVRYKGQKTHKYLASLIKEQYPSIVSIYERRKKEGTLSPLNSDSYSESEPESESESEEDDIYSNDSESIRRSSRVSSHRLPHSPRKTRLQTVYVPDSDEEDNAANSDSTGSAPITRRRSARSKAIVVNLGSGESSQAEDDSEYDQSARKRTARQKAAPKSRVKPPRAEYGRIHPISGLEAEELDDAEVIMRRHRLYCEKCQESPTHELLAKAKKRSGKKRQRKRKEDDDLEEDSEDELDRIATKGGWVRCLKCPVAAHWNCLPGTQKDEILKAIRSRERDAWLSQQPQGEEINVERDGPKKRKGLSDEQMTEFFCGSCVKGGVCIGCMEETAKHGQTQAAETGDGDTTSKEPTNTEDNDAFLFRCLTCKRVSHYEHLPTPPKLDNDSSLVEIAEHYQAKWLCGDCSTLNYSVDKIIAWRPYPKNAVEPADEPVIWKNKLPREYLIKWVDRSYRRLTWVPHMWLVSTHRQKLRNFLSAGAKVDLLETPAIRHKATDDEPPPIFTGDAREESKSSTPQPTLPNVAMPDAEARISPSWKSIDRILDLLVWNPKKPTKAKGKGKGRVRVVESDEEEDAEDEEIDEAYELLFAHGEEPAESVTQGLNEWERQNGEFDVATDAKLVVWCFIKWHDLGYEDATWDTPPRPDDPAYPAFEKALKRFLAGRKVEVPKLNKQAMAAYEARPPEEYKRYLLQDAADLKLGQDEALKLMPFQVTGFNWLLKNWWVKQPSILADEMGLGKTVQIASFIGKIATEFKAFPALVVVPNSTLTNWIREFERWAPVLRVVPFHGEAQGRSVIKDFELKFDFHVMVATYETLLNQKDFTTVFKRHAPWKVLIIDEGQRLKSDSSLLFRKLNELHSMHRILMTGTPLNNNIRELFNLMNFLDPVNWNDPEALERDHEQLTEESVKKLHVSLRPYFLRRLKTEVLTLPPKNEVIIPVSMAPLQKEIYRGILTHNTDLLNGLAQGPESARPASKKINNILMQLRKCLQHPYLFRDDIEPTGLAPQEAHDKLVDASAKFRFLKTFLPKLKARGHRVLLFSQFVIALNVVEDFLNGEGFKYLRLDGNTKGSERQKGMDEFNKPGSDVFIYLLSTRAGGVGINLTSADTVIIFDPDFNPHQDLQAIARSYRFGQNKTCLVFKFMVKGSAEERIMQIGKKKLALDHLIVQKMDEGEAAEDVQSILTFGAQALFEEENGANEITYSDADIENLIIKTEQEPPAEEKKDAEGGNAFSFAKVWTADKDVLEDLGDEDQAVGDSWAQTLEKITQEAAKASAQQVLVSGRGVRRKATGAPQIQNYDEQDSPKKGKKKVKSSKMVPGSVSDGSSFHGGSDIESGSDADSGNGEPDDDFEMVQPEPEKPTKQPLTAIHNLQRPCALCGRGHAAGNCAMTEKSEYLVEYREMLINHADDEPFELREAAVRKIDEKLKDRGHLHMVINQPLHLVKKTAPAPRPVATSTTTSAQAAPSTHYRVPSSSKRPASPIDHRPQPKKAKLSPCLLCANQSTHELEACPVIKQGPARVSQEIARLEAVPGAETLLSSLQAIMRRQMLAANGSGMAR